MIALFEKTDKYQKYKIILRGKLQYFWIREF